jgi:O-antigen/teichoic acid export membrane protein
VLASGLVISLISTGLNMNLVPRYGVYGAAFTILVSNGLYLSIYYYFFRFYKKKHLLFPEKLPDPPINF